MVWGCLGHFNNLRSAQTVVVNWWKQNFHGHIARKFRINHLQVDLISPFCLQYISVYPMKTTVFCLVNWSRGLWHLNRPDQLEVMDANHFKDVTLGSCELDLRSVQPVGHLRRFRQDGLVQKKATPKKIE